MVRYAKHPVSDDGWTDWIVPAKTHRIACCDCGLIHDFEFRIVEDFVEFRARRNERATGQRRSKLTRVTAALALASKAVGAFGR